LTSTRSTQSFYSRRERVVNKSLDIFRSAESKKVRTRAHWPSKREDVKQACSSRCARHFWQLLIQLEVDFIHLGVLNEHGVFWVTRSKESLCFRVVKKLPKGVDKRIFGDEAIVLKNKTPGPIIPNPFVDYQNEVAVRIRYLAAISRTEDPDSQVTAKLGADRRHL
jgi:hypothetical protein